MTLKTNIDAECRSLDFIFISVFWATTNSNFHWPSNMKYFFRIGIFLFSLFLVHPASSSGFPRHPLQMTDGKSSSDTLHRYIDRMIDDSTFSPCFIGIKIVSVNDGRILYERNAEKLFHPASNTKLFTTATALHILDSKFRCKTEFSIEGKIVKHILRGNFVLKGFGDPLFTTDDLDSIVNLVKKKGITTIRGNLIGNESYFDDVPWGRGWMWDDEPDPDEAFISPLTINDNAIDVIVSPGQQKGMQPSIQYKPQTSQCRTINNGETTNDTSIPPLHVTRKRGENTFEITGRIEPGSLPQKFSFSVYQPSMFTLRLLKERLQINGITVTGSLLLDSTTSSETHGMEFSHPIDSIIHRINKESDNIAAENILKILGAEYFHTIGSTESGLQAVREYLDHVGIDTSAITLVDGSGVSLYNAVTPNTIVGLLMKQHQNQRTFNRFYESLPVAGTDGTLRYRMRGTTAEGNVHAKTGSLTGVSALSGYATTKSGTLLAFSFLAEYFPKDIGLLRNLQDRVLEFLTSFREK